MAEESLESKTDFGRNLSVILEFSGVDKKRGKYLSESVNSIRITNYINAIWPQIVITASVDNYQILDNDIFGQKDIKLKMTLSGESSTIYSRQEFDLVVLQSNLYLPFKRLTANIQEDRLSDPIFFSTVPSSCISAMGTFVNYIREEEETNLDPVGIIKDIIKKIGLTESSIIGEAGKNKNVVPQIVVPPLSLNQAVEYVNTHYPLYESPMFKYCDIDGKILIHSLRDKLEDKREIEIYQVGNIPEDALKKHKELESLATGKIFSAEQFIVNEPVESLQTANTSILSHGYTRAFIQHPSDNLYNISHGDIETIVSDYGIQDENSIIKYNETLKSRKKYFIDSSGVDDDTILRNTTSELFSSNCSLRVKLNRNIIFDKILYIGKSVSFKSFIMEYEQFNGKYIIETSEYIISKKGSAWDMTCYLVLGRESHRKRDNK